MPQEMVSLPLSSGTLQDTRKTLGFCRMISMVTCGILLRPLPRFPPAPSPGCAAVSPPATVPSPAPPSVLFCPRVPGSQVGRGHQHGPAPREAEAAIRGRPQWLPGNPSENRERGHGAACRRRAELAGRPWESAGLAELAAVW